MGVRSKVMSRVRKARARLSTDIPESEKREIISVTYWAANGDTTPRLFKRLDAVAESKRALTW